MAVIYLTAQRLNKKHLLILTWTSVEQRLCLHLCVIIGAFHFGKYQAR